MADEQRYDLRESQALWPGDGAVCKRITGEPLDHDILYLMDRADRFHELRVLVVGKVPRRRQQ